MFILLKPCLCVTKSDFCVQGSIFISFFFFFKDNPVTKSKCCHCTYLSDSYQVNIPTISNILCTDKCLWIEFWMRSLPFSNGNLNHLRDVFQTSLLFSCDVGTHSNQAYGEKKQAKNQNTCFFFLSKSCYWGTVQINSLIVNHKLIDKFLFDPPNCTD